MFSVLSHLQEEGDDRPKQLKMTTYELHIVENAGWVHNAKKVLPYMPDLSPAEVIFSYFGPFSGNYNIDWGTATYTKRSHELTNVEIECFPKNQFEVATYVRVDSREGGIYSPAGYYTLLSPVEFTDKEKLYDEVALYDGRCPLEYSECLDRNDEEHCISDENLKLTQFCIIRADPNLAMCADDELKKLRVAHMLKFGNAIVDLRLTLIDERVGFTTVRQLERTAAVHPSDTYSNLLVRLGSRIVGLNAAGYSLFQLAFEDDDVCPKHHHIIGTDPRPMIVHFSSKDLSAVKQVINLSVFKQPDYKNPARSYTFHLRGDPKSSAKTKVFRQCSGLSLSVYIETAIFLNAERCEIGIEGFVLSKKQDVYYVEMICKHRRAVTTYCHRNYHTVVCNNSLQTVSDLCGRLSDKLGYNPDQFSSLMLCPGGPGDPMDIEPSTPLHLFGCYSIIVEDCICNTWLLDLK